MPDPGFGNPNGREIQIANGYLKNTRGETSQDFQDNWRSFNGSLSGSENPGNPDGSKNIPDASTKQWTQIFTGQSIPGFSSNADFLRTLVRYDDTGEGKNGIGVMFDTVHADTGEAGTYYTRIRVSYLIRFTGPWSFPLTSSARTYLKGFGSYGYGAGWGINEENWVVGSWNNWRSLNLDKYLGPFDDGGGVANTQWNITRYNPRNNAYPSHNSGHDAMADMNFDYSSYPSPNTWYRVIEEVYIQPGDSPDQWWTYFGTDLNMNGEAALGASESNSRQGDWDSSASQDAAPGFRCWTLGKFDLSGLWYQDGAGTALGNDKYIDIADFHAWDQSQDGGPVNQPPSPPSNPWPEDNQFFVHTSDLNLSWAASTDPENDPVQYNVYFGTEDPPTHLIAENLTTNEYALVDPYNPLQTDTVYYWYVKAKDDQGASSTGPIWKFTTFSAGGNGPPTVPSNPSPVNGAINVAWPDPVWQTYLSWAHSEDPEEDPVGYEIKFGPQQPPQTIIAENQPGNTIIGIQLEGIFGVPNPNTTYYWKVTAKSPAGIVEVTNNNAPIGTPITTTVWWNNTLYAGIRTREECNGSPGHGTLYIHKFLPATATWEQQDWYLNTGDPDTHCDGGSTWLCDGPDCGETVGTMLASPDGSLMLMTTESRPQGSIWTYNTAGTLTRYNIMNDDGSKKLNLHWGLSACVNTVDDEVLYVFSGDVDHLGYTDYEDAEASNAIYVCPGSDGYVPDNNGIPDARLTGNLRSVIFSSIYSGGYYWLFGGRNTTHSEWKDENSTIIIRSSDGGTTWSEWTPPAFCGALIDCVVHNGKAYICNHAGNQQRELAIYRTSNWLSWERVWQSNDYYGDDSVIENLYSWNDKLFAVGGNGTDTAFVLYSTNNGDTWSLLWTGNFKSANTFFTKNDDYLYFWARGTDETASMMRIDDTTVTQETPGPIWSFTTEEDLTNNPPTVPILISPADMSTLQGTLAPLFRWNQSTDDGLPTFPGVVRYTLYVDTTDPINEADPYLKVTHISQPDDPTDPVVYYANEMVPETTYYWKVVANDGELQTESDTWEFTTPSAGSVEAIIASANGPYFAGTGEQITFDGGGTYHTQGVQQSLLYFQWDFGDGTEAPDCEIRDETGQAATSWIIPGEIQVGNTVSTYISVKNTGNTTYTINATETCTEFSIENGGGPIVLHPSEIQRVDILFTPETAGQKSCVIDFGTECPCEQFTISATAIDEPPSYDTRIWQRYTIKLDSNTAYSNAYADVEVRCQYTAPSGKSVRINGFWDGTSGGTHTFRFRYFYPEVGTWTYSIQTDPVDPDLEGITGTVEVGPATSSETRTLYTKGAPYAYAEDTQYFKYADGDPFFFFGDTMWLPWGNFNYTDWNTYLQDRRNKGFTTIMVMLGWCHASTNCWCYTFRNGGCQGSATYNIEPWVGGYCDADEPNPAFFQAVDEMVHQINEHDMVCIFTGLKNPGDDGITLTKRRRYATWMAARMAGNHTIVSAPMDDHWAESNDMRSVSNSLDSTYKAGAGDLDKYRMITAHMESKAYNCDTLNLFDYDCHFDSESWLDFNGYQSGLYSGSVRASILRARGMANHFYGNVGSTKPCVNLEPFYYMPPSFWDATYEADLKNLSLSGDNVEEGNRYVSRACMYFSFLQGAKGHMVGIWGIWDYGRYRLSHCATPATSWENALNNVFSVDAARIIDLFKNTYANVWPRLEPHNHIINNQPSTDYYEMVAAATTDQTHYFVYIPRKGNSEVRLDMRSLAGPGTAQFYNARNDTWLDAGNFTALETDKVFQNPNSNDDILLICTIDSNPPPPPPPDPPDCNADYDSVDFGFVEVGQPSPITTITISNPSPTQHLIANIFKDEFNVDCDVFTLAWGGGQHVIDPLSEHTVGVYFTPVEPKYYSCILGITPVGQGGVPYPDPCDQVLFTGIGDDSGGGLPPPPPPPPGGECTTSTTALDPHQTIAQDLCGESPNTTITPWENWFIYRQNSAVWHDGWMKNIPENAATKPLILVPSSPPTWDITRRGRVSVTALVSENMIGAGGTANKSWVAVSSIAPNLMNIWDPFCDNAPAHPGLTKLEITGGVWPEFIIWHHVPGRPSWGDGGSSWRNLGQIGNPPASVQWSVPTSLFIQWGLTSTSGPDYGGPVYSITVGIGSKASTYSVEFYPEQLTGTLTFSNYLIFGYFTPDWGELGDVWFRPPIITEI